MALERSTCECQPSQGLVHQNSCRRDHCFVATSPPAPPGRGGRRAKQQQQQNHPPLHHLSEMAGRYPSSPATNARSRSPLLLLTLFLIGSSVLFFLFSLSSTSRSPPSFYQTRLPETSFLISLEHFLTRRSPRSSIPPDDTVDVGADDNAVIRLDASVYGSESRRLLSDPYYPLNLPLRVYVYEMPHKFTYDLLWLFYNTYKQTSNLTSNGSPVHRLIEQVSLSAQAVQLRSVIRNLFLLKFS